MRPNENKKITSLHNASIKKVIELRERKTRDETQRIIVEGFREILRAYEGSVVFRQLYTCPEFFHHRGEEDIIEKLQSKNTEIFEVSDGVFGKISFGDRREGLVAVCERPRTYFSDLKLQDQPFFVVVEKLEKPGNLGAILRVCDGVGIHGLIVCEGQTDIYNPNVIRASIGTVFSVKVVEGSNEEALKFLRQHHIKICVTSPHSGAVYTETDYKIPLAVVAGSEEEGLSDFWFKNADLNIKIPMQGKTDSLNVSVSTAIVIYEVLRQRSR